MSHKTKPTPSHPTESHSEDVEFDWQRHLRWLAPLSLAILILATVFLWLQSRRADVRIEAARAYSLASLSQSVEDLEAVAAAYPDQPEAPLALLQVGALQFNDGDYETAKRTYQSFIDLFRAHPLAENAAWGLLLSEESLGNLDFALEGYLKYDAEDLLYPEALLGRARIHEKQDRWEEAKKVYATIQSELPDTVWAQQAAQFEKIVEVRLRSPEKAEPAKDTPSSAETTGTVPSEAQTAEKPAEAPAGD